MTGSDFLTDEQEAFAAHVGGVFVNACPGAGKTRTILARLVNIASALPQRRGVAVLSFTNSAVEEFRARCQAAGIGTLLKHPSYMGTLDAFVRNFIVLPVCGATSPTRPLILDSWDRLGINIRLSGPSAFRGDGVSLDMFEPETNTIDPNKISHNGLRNHVVQHRVRYEQAAARRRHGLLQAGYLSSDDARMKSLQLIRDPEAAQDLGNALAARFYEVMVDEGQDCNPLDLEILTWLRTHGVQITFVCDPDQSIYEFRQGNPAQVQAFKETYLPNSCLELAGNFRSSPAVCSLAATLKTGGSSDRSVGRTANVEHPVQLLTYESRTPTAAIGRAFFDRIAELNLGAEDAIILAHSGKVAQRAAGVVASSSNGSSRIAILARQVAEFWSPSSTARTRESVLLAVEGMLLDLMELRYESEHLLKTVERLGLDRRAHRRRSLQFLMRLPKTCADSDADRLAWMNHVHMEAAHLNLSLPAGATVRNFFRRPTSAEWSIPLQERIDVGVPCAKIHEAKGREYGSVCVVIPPNRAPQNRGDALLESWERQSDGEAKRVLYVGVTRAQHFAAIALPIALAERCCAILAAGAVPYTRRDL